MKWFLAVQSLYSAKYPTKITINQKVAEYLMSHSLSRTVSPSLSELIWLVHKSCWHQQGLKLDYSCTHTHTHTSWRLLSEVRTAAGSVVIMRTWITDLSFIIPWLSLTFKKPLTPLRFTLVYISYGSTPNTHTCPLAIHSQGFRAPVRVGMISVIIQGPNDTDRAVNYTLTSFSQLPPVL